MTKELKIIKDFKTFCQIGLNDKMIDDLSKALTEYAFRTGPIEDMHANNQLSQKDMETLNKYMVNRLAGFFTMLRRGELDKLDKVLSFYTRLVSGWDKAKPDLKDFEVIE